MLDWRKQQQAHAAVKLAIEDALDRSLPPAYSPEMFKQKCEAVYLHVYDSYYGAGRSLYASALSSRSRTAFRPVPMGLQPLSRGDERLKSLLPA